ncbi:hypothetical protein ONZ45_g1464 [Pleurotus djamor]|nr:hypothetical protein ONZ45_g1464 [Pleurotus djamor]
MFSVFTLLYATSVLSGAVLAKPLTRRQGSPPPICTPGFTGDDPYDWNNSEAIGFANGLKSGSTILKVPAAGRPLFKFTKIESSPPSFTIEPFGGSNLAVGLLPNNSLALTENKGVNGNTRFIIECGDCGSFVEDNCFMRLADKPELEDSQRFNYFKQVAPSTSAPLPSSTAVTSTTWPHEHDKASTTTNTHLPSPTPSVCNPNFEFEGVRVANSATYWGAPSFESNVDLVGETDFNKRLEIRFEQTGSPNPYYVAKSLNGSNLVIATRAVNDNLYFISGDENNQRKFFKIECSAFCRGANSVVPGDLSADGCVIKSAFNDKCVQLGNGPSAGNVGDRIFLNTCDGTDSQRFNFLTSPFKQSGRPTSDLAGNAQVRLSNSGDDDTSSELKELIRNSYIAIGLLGASLLAIIILGAVALSRGCMKGRDSKSRYTVVAGKGELDGFTINPHSGRYSD